eukprot:tig00000802_g4310.t1
MQPAAAWGAAARPLTRFASSADSSGDQDSDGTTDAAALREGMRTAHFLKSLRRIELGTETEEDRLLLLSETSFRSRDHVMALLAERKRQVDASSSQRRIARSWFVDGSDTCLVDVDDVWGAERRALEAAAARLPFERRALLQDNEAYDARLLEIDEQVPRARPQRPARRWLALDSNSWQLAELAMRPGRRRLSAPAAAPGPLELATPAPDQPSDPPAGPPADLDGLAGARAAARAELAAAEERARAAAAAPPKPPAPPVPEARARVEALLAESYPGLFSSPLATAASAPPERPGRAAPRSREAILASLRSEQEARRASAAQGAADPGSSPAAAVGDEIAAEIAAKKLERARGRLRSVGFAGPGEAEERGDEGPPPEALRPAASAPPSVHLSAWADPAPGPSGPSGGPRASPRSSAGARAPRPRVPPPLSPRPSLTAPAPAPPSPPPRPPAAPAAPRLSPGARPLSPGGRPLSPDGRPLSPGARPLSPGGRALSPDGRPLSSGGRPLSSSGRPLSPGPNARPKTSGPPPPVRTGNLYPLRTVARRSLPTPSSPPQSGASQRPASPPREVARDPFKQRRPLLFHAAAIEAPDPLLSPSGSLPALAVGPHGPASIPPSISPKGFLGVGLPPTPAGPGSHLGRRHSLSVL